MGEYFRIESPEDLLEYKRIVENTKSAELPDARLMNDIDMTGVDWEPIVMNKILLNPFDNFAPFNDMQRSVFDGDGHTIKGLETNSAKKIMTNISVFPAPRACGTYVQPMGTLFYTSGNLQIRDLTLKGRLSILEKPVMRTSKFINVVVGGLTGHSAKDGKIENCRVEVDIEYNQKSSNVSSVAGIVGALEGKMEDCSYRGTFSGGWGIGLAYMNSGLITDSYAENDDENKDFYPEVNRRVVYALNGYGLPDEPSYIGMVDNIGLYVPGKPYFKRTNSQWHFFASETVTNLLRDDAFLEKKLKESYWVNVVVHKMAKTVEECCRAGHGFGWGGFSAVSCSQLPLRYCRCKTNREAKAYSSRYGLMVETLVKESPSFRKALLAEIEEDYNKTVDRLKGCMTSEKRVVGILKAAKKLDDYDNAVEADMTFADDMYIR